MTGQAAHLRSVCLGNSLCPTSGGLAVRPSLLPGKVPARHFAQSQCAGTGQRRGLE